MKEKELYDSQTRYIKQDLKSNEKNLMEVAQRIARIEEEQLYKIGNYKNIIDYCKKEFNLERNRVWEFKKVVYRFCDKRKNFNSYSTSYCVKSFFKDYDYSKLLALHDITEEEIEQLGIKPVMSVREIKRIVKRYKNELMGSSSENVENEEEKKEVIPEEHYNLKYALMVFDMDDTYIRDKKRKIPTIHGVNYLRDLDTKFVTQDNSTS